MSYHTALAGMQGMAGTRARGSAAQGCCPLVPRCMLCAQLWLVVAAVMLRHVTLTLCHCSMPAVLCSLVRPLQEPQAR